MSPMRKDENNSFLQDPKVSPGPQGMDLAIIFPPLSLRAGRRILTPHRKEEILKKHLAR